MNTVDLEIALAASDAIAARRPGHNPYALRLEVSAAAAVAAEVRAGATWPAAFARRFTPTRRNAAIARQFGWPLTVAHGNWVATS